MNSSLAPLMLVLLAGVLFMLPLLPALLELRLKRDAQPLNVIQQHGGESATSLMVSAPIWRSCKVPCNSALFPEPQ